MTATDAAGLAAADPSVQPVGQQGSRDWDDVSFDTEPSRYRHWTMDVAGPVATLVLDVAEDGGIVPGYELKMNSYDLGVDIELHDAVQRLRFEHPEVTAVVVTSGKERTFCSGANIGMLAQSAHAWKVNFCKFTNETRNTMEDATEHSGQIYLAALTGSAAGGGYELALACEEILLVEDASSAVSLPEVPLLGVLPGTGGLTRLVDKRGVRRDRADVFATTAEGMRGRRAVQWRLVDESVPRRDFDAALRRRVEAAVSRSSRASGSGRPPGPPGGPAAAVVPAGGGAGGVALTPLRRRAGADVTEYEHVRVEIDRSLGAAALTVSGPAEVPPDLAAIHSQRAAAWPLAMARELDDAVLRLRFNEVDVGTWVFRTAGDPAKVAEWDSLMLASRGDWLVNEIVQLWKRTLKRLESSSRSMIALIEPGSCFVGSLLELALAADRQYMLDGQFTDEDDPAPPAVIRLNELNLGLLPAGSGLSRLELRFLGSAADLAAATAAAGRDLDGAAAAALGLVTAAPDDLDWADEVRLVLEERGGFSPDALTGMEANLRFAGPETLETKIFGRLSAWQNWIFQRPNAAGPQGALRRYGTGQRADFDRKRV